MKGVGVEFVFLGGFYRGGMLDLGFGGKGRGEERRREGEYIGQ